MGGYYINNTNTTKYIQKTKKAKYKTLFSNTVVFAISTFSSKFLGILMASFYTRVMSTEQLASGDLIINTANLLAPIASICIGESIIRFGLDKSYKKSDVFSSGMIIFIIGFLALLLFTPLIMSEQSISDNIILVYLYVLCSCTKTLCAQFVRARQLIKLFAVDGILTTVYVVVFNLIALGVLNLGVQGYVMSVILADFISIIFLFYMGSLYKYIKLKIDKNIFKPMLFFAIPMIPNAVSWWITNVSDLFFVNAYAGKEIAGLYTISYKIPTIITAVSLIFSKAWQISAFTEENEKEQRRFFTKIFKLYQGFIMIAASGLIMLIKPITSIMFGKEFFDSWEYVPILIIGVAFSCFVTFLGSVYMAKKKTMMSMVTTIIGAIINIAFNFLLIPLIGAQGATIATFFSFFIVFILRVITTRKLIKMEYGIKRLCFATLIVFIQSTFLLLEIDNAFIVQILSLLCIILIYIVSFINDRRR